MALAPVIPDFSGGGVLTVTAAQQLSSALNWLFNVPAYRGRQTVAQTLTSSVWASIALDIDDLDNDPTGAGGHSVSVNNSRYAPVYAGWYCLLGGEAWTNMGSPAGRRGTRFAVNGTALRGSASIYTTSSALPGAYPHRGILTFLGVGDYAEPQAFFEGGGTLNTNVGDFTEPSFDVFWVRNA